MVSYTIPEHGFQRPRVANVSADRSRTLAIPSTTNFGYASFSSAASLSVSPPPKRNLKGLLPWNIPGNRELSHPGRISSVNGGVCGAHYDEPWIYDGTANHRYPAASVAIECLKNVPIMMRKYIRQIMSIEDNESTAYS
jgi:hypothetical protein